MNFEKLLTERKIEKIEKNETDLEVIGKDINAARNSFLSGDFDWALAIAYNSVLMSIRMLMSYLGYRPIGKEHHKNTFDFLRETEFDQELTEFFDKIRRKRNKVVYDVTENISEEVADEVIKKAEVFVQKIRTFVQKIRTGAKNER